MFWIRQSWLQYEVVWNPNHIDVLKDKHPNGYRVSREDFISIRLGMSMPSYRQFIVVKHKDFGGIEFQVLPILSHLVKKGHPSQLFQQPAKGDPKYPSG